MRFWPGLLLLVVAAVCAVLLWPPPASAPPRDAEPGEAAQQAVGAAPRAQDTGAPAIAEPAGGEAVDGGEVTRHSAEDADPEATWVARGFVTDLADAPVADARITATLHAGADAGGEVLASAELRSDEKGRFSWPLRPPARSVFVDVQPQVPEGHRGWGRGERVPAGGDAPQELVVLVFPLDFRVTGVVRGHDGEPIAGATVQTLSSAWTAGAEGRYELRISSQWSSMDLYAHAEGHAQMRETVRTDGDGAVMDFDLLPEFAVSGRVVDEDGRGLAGARLNASGLRRVTAESGPDGSFRLGHMHPDRSRYTVFVRKGGYVLATAELDPTGGPVTGMVIVLQSGARVEGRVVDESGQPLVGSEVFVAESRYDFRRRDAISDDAGRFAITDVEHGARRLHALHPGHAPTRMDLEIREGVTAHPVGDVVLRPGHFIAGRVVDDTGAPAPEVVVAVMRDDRFTGIRAHTAADGSFRLQDLAPEGLGLQVYGDGYVRAERTLEVEDFDRDDHEIVLERAGGIAGRAVDGRSGEGLPAFRIQLSFPRELEPGEESVGSYMAEWGDPGVQFADTDGHWAVDEEEFRVGRFVTVRVLAEGFATRELAKVRVEADPDPDALVIEMFPGQRLSGTVLPARGGDPIEGARVVLLNEAQMQGRQRIGPSDAPVARSDRFGRFELLDLAAGSFWLRAEHPDWKPAVIGPLEIPERGALQEQRILLEKGATIRGVALDADGDPLAGTAVSVRAAWSAGSAPERSRMVTDLRGRFAFENREDGEHDLALHEDGEGGSLRLLEMRVAVRDGEDVEVVLQAAGSGSVSGRVRSAGSLPEGLAVTLERVDASDGSGTAASSRPRVTVLSARVEEGNFRFPAVEPGRYRYRFATATSSWAPRDAVVTVAAGEEARIRWSLD